ncbi:hypothetical protein [Halorussus ruber]|uniref:hypothetical protein n=1 Tax=Halorussus ruber TaxID=1126238 RepID=UPI001092EA70|nr:hypothetical protein [Halorussus ruber]
MNGSRRRLLAASAGLVASVSGCLSSLGDGGLEGVDSSDDVSEAETTESRTPTTTSREYADTVEVTTTIRRDDLEYVESNDTVRYVAGWQTNHSGETPTRQPVYSTVPFERWVETECASAAAERVGEVLAERLDGNDDGIATGVTTETGEKTALVEHQTRLDPEGDLISKPSVSYRRVKRVAPETVVVELTFAGRTRTCGVPVTTREATIRQA